MIIIYIMNGNFRSPELVKRYEYSYYDLQTPLNANIAKNNRQTKDNYLFVVDNISEANPIDWYNSYIECNFKLVQLADNVRIPAGLRNPVAAAQFCTSRNGHTFIREIKVEGNGITVYNNTRANESSNVLSLLKYTKEYVESTGKDQLFYLDQNTGEAQPNPATADTYNEGFALRKN